MGVTGPAEEGGADGTEEYTKTKLPNHKEQKAQRQINLIIKHQRI